jgi:ABC-2 type transport system permease protein
MWERVWVIVRKELRQNLRDPRLRAGMFLPPIIQLMVFGFAVNLDVEHARLIWTDRDRTPESRELLAAFQGSPRFEVVSFAGEPAEVNRLLDHGDVDAAVQVLPGFGRDVKRGSAAAVQILLDGSNSNTASIISNYAAQIVGRFSREKLADLQKQKLVGPTFAAGGPIGLKAPRLEAESRIWFNAEMRSRNYFVPGVVVNIMVLVTLSLTSMAIVREKEIGTMEQLIVTPIRPVELILGKTLPFALIGVIDIVLVMTIALFVFDVPFRGSPLVLMFGACLFLLSTLGAGLFISTISRTQQQALLSTFLCFLPFFLLSGFSFPVRNMPAAIQWFTYINPVRYFMEIVRQIFLKGVGLEVLWPQFLALGGFGVLILSASAARFHKRLE